MIKYNIDTSNITNEDQLCIYNHGKFYDCYKSYVIFLETNMTKIFEVPKGKEHVPILEMADGKITHTLHLVFHSEDRVRHGILVTHSECDSEHFDQVECEWEYKEGISVFRHKSTNLLVLCCDPHIKTWVSEDVADAIYDFVNFPKNCDHDHF